MSEKTFPYYLANEPKMPNTDLEVIDKYSGEVGMRVAMADAAAIDEAIVAAEQAAPPMREIGAWRRKEILEHCVARFRERFEELALSLCVEAGKPIRDSRGEVTRLIVSLCVEAGKPIRDSRGEVTRLIDTFTIAAEEAVRMPGELLPLDISPRAAGYSGMWKRVPIGPVALITPFNFPLNLAAHKVAPALACGCPFVLKPASYTPIGALIIGEILAETDLPKGAFSILPCRGAAAEPLATDDRFKVLSFTGSPDVGWALKAKAGRKKVSLELGGNAAVILDHDTDLDDAVERIIFGGYYQSGQSCISVQRILVHEKIYDQFRERLVPEVRALKMGDPKDEETFIGPMIDEGEAERLVEWVGSAVRRGADLLCGGEREGAMMQPTLLENVPEDEPVSCKEAFGPLTVLSKFRDFDQALEQADRSIYGLQAGVFTRDIYKAHRAWDRLEVGGVVIGDVPSFRVDNMPYGGVKNSGLGREGIVFAMEEMTEIRLMVLRTRGS
jgi:acyl-CoA reductase-like NAD-dependent aldehyde dehydrogenase